jgi:hypothetical protein
MPGIKCGANASLFLASVQTAVDGRSFFVPSIRALDNND